MRVGDRLVALNGAEIGEAPGGSLGEMLSAAGWWDAEAGQGGGVTLLAVRGEPCRDATPSPPGPSPPDAAGGGTGGSGSDGSSSEVSADGEAGGEAGGAAGGAAGEARPRATSALASLASFASPPSLRGGKVTFGGAADCNETGRARRSTWSGGSPEEVAQTPHVSRDDEARSEGEEEEWVFEVDTPGVKRRGGGQLLERALGRRANSGGGGGGGEAKGGETKGGETKAATGRFTADQLYAALSPVIGRWGRPLESPLGSEPGSSNGAGNPPRTPSSGSEPAEQPDGGGGGGRGGDADGVAEPSPTSGPSPWLLVPPPAPLDVADDDTDAADAAVASAGAAASAAGSASGEAAPPPQPTAAPPRRGHRRNRHTMGAEGYSMASLLRKLPSLPEIAAQAVGSGSGASPSREAARISQALRETAPRGVLQLQLLSLDGAAAADAAAAAGAALWWSVEMDGVTVETCRAVRAAGCSHSTFIWEWRQWLWWSLPKATATAAADATEAAALAAAGLGGGGGALTFRLLRASPAAGRPAVGERDVTEIGWAQLELGADSVPTHASTLAALEVRTAPKRSAEQEEEEEGEEGGDGGGGGGVAGTLHVRFYLHAFAAGQEPLEPMGLPHDAYGFQVRPANVGAYQAHLRSVEQDAPMWLAQWNSLMRGVASDAELPAEARSLATSVLSRGVPPQHRPHVWLCLTGARELMQRSARGGRDYWQLAAAAEGAVPHDIRRQVEYDLPRTFPQHADFMPGGGGGGGDGASARVDTPALASLRRVLLAFAMYEPSVGYCQSLNFVAAMLILVGGEEGGFWMLAAICANVIPDYHTHQMTGLRIDTQAAMTRTHTAHALHVPCTYSTPVHAHCCLTTATRAPRTVQAVATLVGATLPKLEAHFNSLGVPLEILASQARCTYYYGCTYCYGYT